MSLHSVPLSSLKPARLVRKPTDEAIDAMAQSMSDIGQLTPIGIDSGGNVLFGVTRCMAAKKLGWKEILVREFPPESEPGEALRMTVSENTVRSQMTFVEKADAIHTYAKLTGKSLQEAGRDLGYKQADVSKCIKTDQRLTPENKKRLLDAAVGGSLAYLYSQEADPRLQAELILRG
ncbi:MAG: ParB N-terminal domain-containing protein, partial [Planctomycetales bacterium]|nr:ParB N-terminal domain-containing protein [Planctomycetales bacterium]